MITGLRQTGSAPGWRDGAGGPLAFAVAGNRDEIEGGVDVDGAGKVREKERGTFENANHHQFLVVQVPRDLGSHFCDFLGYLLTSVEDFEPLVGDGGHEDSIA